MHKAYQSILPCNSRILKEKWDRKYYEEHRQKVQEAKPMVDTKAPQTYVHLHLKLKKLQLEEERLATIERDNRILLEKMSQIMRTKGRVDHRNNYVHRSLNREKRQRELLRVTKENQEILKRILAREPEYNHLQWEKEWDENEAFMDSISRYPRDWWDQEQKEKESRKKEAKKKRQEENKGRKSRTPRERRRTKSREEKSEDEEEEEERKDEVDEVAAAQEKEETDGGKEDTKEQEKVKEEEQEKQEEEKVKDEEQEKQEDKKEEEEEKKEEEEKAEEEKKEEEPEAA